MSHTKTLITAAAAALTGSAALAGSHLTEVKFGTNWVAQAEHGGYYQAVADGSYEACGLNVTIVPGGPQVNNRALMIAGKIDFYMGGNMLFPWNGRQEGIPFKVVAAHFQKEPQVLMTHPGKASEFGDLAGLDKQIIGDGAYASWYQWLATDYGWDASKRVPYTYNPAPFMVQPLASAFAAVGRGPMEAAASLGASPLDAFFRVALPLSARGFLTASVLTFAHTVGEFGVVLMVGGAIPGETKVVSIAVYEHVETLRYAEAHALSAGLLIFSFVVLLAVYARQRRFPVHVG